MKKIWSVLLCLMMLFMYVPAVPADEAPAEAAAGINAGLPDPDSVAGYTYSVAQAGEEEKPLPQTPEAYAASDYAKYGARMAVGEAHLAVVNANGTVAAGGDNTYGQCKVPEELSGVKVKAVAAGSYHTLALTEDGRLFAWGSSRSDAYGMPEPIAIPDEVAAVQGNIKLIAAGSTMSAVVTDSDEVIVWGYNSNNLGTVPAGLGSVVAIGLTNNCAVVLNAEGNVKAWGDKDCATDVLDGNTVAIAVGQYHWLALKKDGTVSVKGSYGSMLRWCGNIANQTGVRAIVGGFRFAGAILADGSVWGWGGTPSGVLNKEGTELIAASANIGAFSCLVSGGAVAVCAMQGDGMIEFAAPSTFATAPINDKFNFLTVPGSNALLSSLAVAGYALAPTFNSDTDSYSVTVPNAVYSVDITATTMDGNAALKINGTAATSGDARTVNDLAEGENLIPVVVTAEDFTTVKTYNLTVKREPLAEDNNSCLSGLEVAGYALAPAFSSDTDSYSVTVPNAVYSVDITATTMNGNAALKINGTAAASGDARTVSDLIVGDNPVTLEVTSADGTSEKTYTLTITRLGEENHAVLSSLVVSPGTLTPEFGASSDNSYSVSVNNSVYGITVTPTAVEQDAVILVNGVTVASGAAQTIDGLAVGANTVTIEVSPADGTAAVTYILTVTRAGSGGLPQTPEDYQESDYAAYARRLAAGEEQVLALKNDGTVTAWGTGGEGQCNVPDGLDNVVAVAAGYSHSLALRADGTVIAWGGNVHGECDIPSGLDDIADISAGNYFSAALDKYGRVLAWGDNTEGQCDIPAGLGDVVDIQCGRSHTLALKADGTVAAWGWNYYGQCDVPSGLDHVVAIAAGFCYSAALKDDGTVVIWGAEGTRFEIENPGLQDVKGIVAGGHYITALKSDGSVVVLGHSGYANEELGIPAELAKKILALSCAESGGGDVLLALNEDGTVTAWGNKYQGQCDVPSGLNLFKNDEPPYSGEAPDIPQTPAGYAAGSYARAAARICGVMGGVAVLNMDGTVKVAIGGFTEHDLTVPEGLDQVTDIASSGSTLMALRDDGTVVVWGYNGDHQREVPEDIGRVTAIATANISSPYCLALREDGTVAAWGGNLYGQLDLPEGLAGVTAIAAGDKHCLALKKDGTVAAWGDNACGECDVPPGLHNVARVYAGYEFSLALKEDGTVVAWGSNKSYERTEYCGQCDVPEGLSGVVDIKIVDSNTCVALKSNGTVVVWGDNGYGCRNVPPGLHDVVAISGIDGITAVKSDGTVAHWAKNPRFKEELLSSLRNVLTISNNTIIFTDGSLQYCNGNISNSSTKTAVLINEALAGLNVLSGHYFNIDSVELLDPAGKSIGSVAGQGGYRIQARVKNNYTDSATGLVIIQVRGGEGANSGSGGRVLGCVGYSSAIPVSGSTISSDFTMPSGISGKAYVDVFVWDGWNTMVPRAAASHELSFDVT